MPGRSETTQLTVWQIWVDTGGTFTDCLAIPPGGGEITRAKVLSNSALRGRIIAAIDSTRLRVQQNWSACDDFVCGFSFRLQRSQATLGLVTRYLAADSIIELDTPVETVGLEHAAFEVTGGEPAPILAARLVTNTPAGKALPPLHMRLATTRGTNALLERRGARVVLFITRGFGDLLLIGDQQRPDLFALKIQKLAPLYERVVEVPGRIDATGSEIAPMDLHGVEREARVLYEQGYRAAAVALMHSHLNPTHEKRVADVLHRIGFDHISISSQIAPLIRIVPRTQTTVVDAYLAPVVSDYLQSVQRHLQHNSDSRLHVMTSAGGLASAERYRACDSLLSGPAGGVGGAAAASRMSGFDRVIGFDMGGTSTDVSRFDGEFEYRFEHMVEGVRLLAPALAIETVAAGGGSICDFSDGLLHVGPHSAGANPGPACYGMGGPLTLTDVNLLLGRIDAEHFEIPIERASAETAADALLARIHSYRADALLTRESLLQGFLDIANERMAATIEKISLRQGYDPREYALVAFGGAGAQHACAIAERLGMSTIVVPADASLLSAFGLGHAAIERFAQRQMLKTLSACQHELQSIIDELSAHAIDEVVAEGVDRAAVDVHRIVANVRLLGQDSTLAIDLAAHDGIPHIRAQFAQRYRDVFGHDVPPEDVKPIELESLRVIAMAGGNDVAESQTSHFACSPTTPPRTINAWFNGREIDAFAFDRASLMQGAQVKGPALVVDRRSACVIDSGWRGVVDAAGALVLQREVTVGSDVHSTSAAYTELFINRFSSIAEEMGHMLQRTALSTNVKERLDFSCTILDSNGELLVNAPHLPVHLGAMGVCVRAVREAIEMREGDVIMTNHPAFGGSHLPDITVITPVYVESTLIAYVANRAHHAEIGGIRPGSMPPDAKTLAEEGVVIRPQHLIKQGRSQFDEIERLLKSGPHPSRAVSDNLADLRAAVAANQRGVLALQQLAKQCGIQAVTDQMREITNRAERVTRAVLRQLPSKRFEATERLDDGSPLRVSVVINENSAVMDFTGSAPVHNGNLNATPAIVRSAVIYVLRLMIGERLPLNEGMMRAVELRIPQGMLNPPFVADPACCPAVVGGNTETSQRIVDTLLKAFNVCACSQGTMNNLLFGSDRFGYYETVCGGTGAGPGFDGADAVHSHMTNTRITDPEIIEHRYPVRVEQFAIRRGSGGSGKWRGGNGAIRELTFLEHMSLSILSQHRVEKPFGIHGGGEGQGGRQRVIRANGAIVDLKSIDGCEVGPGDRLILETPGGGGCGAGS